MDHTQNWSLYVQAGWASESMRRACNAPGQWHRRMWCWLGVPCGSSLDDRAAFLECVGGQGNPGKQAHQDGRSAGDGPVRPLALDFHSQVSSHLLEGRLQLPSQHKPFHHLRRSHCRIGAQESLGVEFTLAVPDQNPADGYGRLARVIPEGRLVSQFQPVPWLGWSRHTRPPAR